MSIKENETQVSIEYEFNKLNILDILDSDTNTNYKFCSYCSKPFTEEFWCKECDPRKIIEGWSSGNLDIDKFIKDTMYDIRNEKDDYPAFLELVPFDRFGDIKQIGEGGFAKVYSAKWIGDKAEHTKQDDGSWKKSVPKPEKVALKRLNGSQNISNGLNFYGITKDPETKEFMMIIKLANMGNLKSVLSNNFSNILWKDKIELLMYSAMDLNNLHKLGYFHKDFHSGNILHATISAVYISDFGLSGPANEQKSNDKICGVLPYIAPEVLNGKPYTLSSDIYSFGVVMAELSSGKPPFHKRKHDFSLALAICNGLRLEFGKGTPEIYKKLAYKCMNANPDQRPTANELYDILRFWDDSTRLNKDDEKFGYKGKEVKSLFEEADKEIPNISTSYEKDPDAIYTSRIFTFTNLPNPINSSIITLYINDNENNIDCQDSQLVNLGISNSLQFKDVDDENSYD